MERLARRLVITFAALLTLGWAQMALAAGYAPRPGDMSLGNPKAPVEVVEWASLSCPHCAHFNEEVFAAFKAKYIDTGRVHFTLREMLTPPQQIAAAGFLTARCAGPAKYFSVVDGVFRSQPEWYAEGADIRASLLKVAKANGLSEDQFEACLKDEAQLKALNARIHQAVEGDKVDSTPTIEINGKRVDGVPQSLAELEAAMAKSPKTKGGR